MSGYNNPKEMITNSLKHGFPNGAEGKIRLTLTLGSDHVIQLRIWDDGIGISDSFELEKSAPFGMQITWNLVIKQLQGTKTTICFTEPDRKQRIPQQ